MPSERGDGDGGTAGGEAGQVAGIMCENNATTEADRGRDDKRIDRQFAARAGRSEKVTGDSGCARPRSHNLCEAARENRIDGDVGASASVQLHEHSRWYSHWEVPLVCATESSSHELMTLQILVWTCERRQRFAVQD